jgi:AbrB family looped-hinge helix DNA binding protein
MSRTATATIDRAGRLVVPKPIREAAGLVPGELLEITFSDGRIEIQPAPRKVRIERRGELHVAVPVEPGPKLTAEQVRETQERIRDRQA